MYKGMWQHALIHIDEILNGIMEHKYHNLNEKSGYWKVVHSTNTEHMGSITHLKYSNPE
jgi:hypothetical protein